MTVPRVHWLSDRIGSAFSHYFSSYAIELARAHVRVDRVSYWPFSMRLAPRMPKLKISYSGYRFPPEIIQHAIWLYPDAASDLGIHETP